MILKYKYLEMDKNYNYHGNMLKLVIYAILKKKNLFQRICFLLILMIPMESPIFRQRV